MTFELDRTWLAAVCRLCDPVFEAADVGFVRQMHIRKAGRVAFVTLREMTGNAAEVALLWEADPKQFAAKYPDSGILESYGTGWPDVTSIDFWVYADASSSQARLSIEGWSDPDNVILSGDGVGDGLAIGREFASILRVPAPTG